MYTATHDSYILWLRNNMAISTLYETVYLCSTMGIASASDN